MPNMILPYPQKEAIRRHLRAAWEAGYVAGREGVRPPYADAGASEFVALATPALITELSREPDPVEQVVNDMLVAYQDLPLCRVCSLPADAHDPRVGLAQHDFAPAPVAEVVR